MIVVRRSNKQIQAHRITAENIERVARWCSGGVKGTALPKDQQVIDLWTNDREVRAAVGDWIVNEDNLFTVYHNVDFNRLFA